MTLSDVMTKITSARFLMTVAFSLTYCLIMLYITKAMVNKTITVETYVAILASFVIIVREITDAYFKREDRALPNGNGNGDEHPVKPLINGQQQ